MASDTPFDSDAANVEELLGSLKRELLDLFDYSDLQGNRTVVRGDLVRALDGARDRWERDGDPDWHAPQVHYGLISKVLGRLQGPLRAFNPSYYLDALNRASLRGRSLEVDEFGMDPAFATRFNRFVDFLYERYWRVEVHGIDSIPHQGPALLVANHSGTLPWDALMVAAAVRREHAGHRTARYLVEDIFMMLPFLAPLLTRGGLIRASRENARRLLRRGEVVGVFPEGAKGIGKRYRNRYQLQRFGRGGFVRLALETGAPIVPLAVVGAEEIMPTIARAQTLVRAVGLPYLPITPLFPALGPLGLIPLPTKWYIAFGRPLTLDQYTAKDADDEILVNRVKEDVRATVQEMVYDLLKERESVWLG